MPTPVVVKGVLRVVAGGAVLYLACAAALFGLMRGSNETAGKALSSLPGAAFAILPLESMWCEARKGTLNVGQEAPDFDLATLEGTSRVRLSALRAGKPVVLVFGSYTCPPFRKEMPAINRVVADYQDRAAFYFVYIEEAHARDVWPLASNAKEKILYGTAKDYAERASVASTCSQALKIKFTVLVDDMSNQAGQRYNAWPTRLYIVDRAGKVAYKSRPGPFGFEAAELEKALSRAGLAAATAHMDPH